MYKLFIFLLCALAVRFLDSLCAFDQYEMSIIPALIAAGGAIGSKVIGGLFSNNSTKNANKLQRQMQQEQNQFNFEQWQRERDFTVDMWNRENEYNSAVNQRKRLEDAGLNPYLMLNGGDAGIASTATTPSSAPAAPSFTPQVPDYSWISDIVNDVGKTVGISLDLEGRKIDNDMKRISAQYQEQELLKSLVEMDERTNNLRADTRKKVEEALNLSVDQSLKRAALKAQEFSNSHMDDMYQKSIRELDDAHNMSVIMQDLQRSNIRLNDRQISLAAQSIAESVARINSLVHQNKLTDAQINTEIQKQKSEINKRVLGRNADSRAEDALDLEFEKSLDAARRNWNRIETPFGGISLPGTPNAVYEYWTNNWNYNLFHRYSRK